MSVVHAEDVRLPDSHVGTLRSPLNVERGRRRHKSNMAPRYQSAPSSTKAISKPYTLELIHPDTSPPLTTASNTMAEHDSQTPGTKAPDLLYHTLLSVLDYHDVTSGYTCTTYPLGTHTSLPAAKSFAAIAIEQRLRYTPEDFVEHSVRYAGEAPEDWRYGNAVVVYARAPAGREFLVELHTTPNHERLPATGPEDTPRLPEEADYLYYVIQRRVDYNQGSDGGLQTTKVQGVYARRVDAKEAARGMLGDKDDYAQYDENSGGKDGQWPFGEDVVVHAVAVTGQNFEVAVRTVPGCQRDHGKKARG